MARVEIDGRTSVTCWQNAARRPRKGRRRLRRDAVSGKRERPISAGEVTVIRAAVERARTRAVSEALLILAPSLRVVSLCGCGCASVFFEGYSRGSEPIADGTGITSSGGAVGVIVWGTSDAITGLEVYDLGAGDDDLQLPVPESIRPW